MKFPTVVTGFLKDRNPQAKFNMHDKIENLDTRQKGAVAEVKASWMDEGQRIKKIFIFQQYPY